MSEYFYVGTKKYLQSARFSEVDKAGMEISTSSLGIELFLWAIGEGDGSINNLLKLEAPVIKSAAWNALPSARPIEKI
jgi:hypothetical protein